MQNSTLAQIEEELAALRDAGLYNAIRTIESPMDAHVQINGRLLLNFCANNYLGLANHPRLRAAAQRGIEAYGVGPGAVRTIAGTTSLHVALEQRLAEFKHAEACITFQSGFAANLATIPALVGLGVMGAKRMLLRSEKVDARTAQDWGIVAEVVSQDLLVQRAREVATEFANDATIALGEMKNLRSNADCRWKG